MSESGTPWVETFDLPPISSGDLHGLSFAVKDFIDIAGRITGCGNPDWKKSHGPALENASCVQLLLAQGARCLGKTITDELAYSLVGENHFYGTPLNPAAPDRVPGGSSSGSASAVASGLVDFALGTDTAGSIRVPASNCGIYGYRPSFGRISLGGVQALAPSFDTVGVLARDAGILKRVARVLLIEQAELQKEITRVLVLEDAWDLADEEVRRRRPVMLSALERAGIEWESLRLKEALPEEGFGELMEWKGIFSAMQPTENWNTFGGWVEATQPALGPRIAENLRVAKETALRFSPEKVEKRERAAALLQSFLRPGLALGLPTTPAIPPLKGKVDYDRATGTYLPRLLAFTTLAGIPGLPQISVPLDPILGFSVIGAKGEDLSLLRLVGRF